MCNEYINIQTNERLDDSRLSFLKGNLMLNNKPDLWIEWNFNRNNKSGFDIFEVTKGYGKNVWWICRECMSEYEATINKRTNGRNCPYCRGRKVNDTNSLASLKPEIAKEWHETLNTKTPYDVTCSSGNKDWWICGNCNSEYESKIIDRNNGKRCPYCSGKKVNHTNSLFSQKPDITSEWNYDKNADLTPHTVTCGSNKKVWWTCNTCKSEWESAISSRSNGKGCPYCAGLKVNHTNSLFLLNPELASEWNYDKNRGLTPHSITCGVDKKVWWKCEYDHEWESMIYSRNSGIGCPYCAGKKLLIGYNDMWTTNPKLANLLANSDDGYKYMQSVNVKVDWKCRDCGFIIENKAISNVKTNGFCCPICSDGIKYPEKFMLNLLGIINIDFIREVSSRTFEWIGSKRYDFYIPALNLIIEAHGGQHFNGGFSTCGGKNLEEEIENDLFKRELAFSNGISHYIELDCRESNMEYIKNSILNSGLADILKLDCVNWIDVAIQSEKSLVFKACNMWEDGLSTKEIADKMSIHLCTVIDYLNRGNKLDICNYDKKESYARGMRIRKRRT